MERHDYNIPTVCVYLEIIHKFKFYGNKTVRKLHVWSSAEISKFINV